MGANSLISRAGTRSRKPTGSLALIAGAEKPLNHAVSSREKTEGPSSVFTPPGCGFRSLPMVQPSFVRATDRVKAVAPHPVRCTTSHSRQRKPMPPSALWLLSANLSGFSFIAKAKTCFLSLLPQLYRLRPKVHRRSVSAYIRTIRRPFHGHRITMGDGIRTRWLRCFDKISRKEERQPRPWRQHPNRAQAKSTKANSLFLNPNDCVTGSI